MFPIAGFGFITYDAPSAVDGVIQEHDKLELGGKRVNIFTALFYVGRRRRVLGEFDLFDFIY
jgi:hypothetical protein